MLAVRTDTLFSEARRSVDVAIDSRMDWPRDHPDLTPLNVVTIIGMDQRGAPDKPNEPMHPLHIDNRLRQRRRILNDQRRRRCLEKHRIATDEVDYAKQELVASSASFGAAQITAVTKACVEGNVEALLRIVDAVGHDPVVNYRTDNGRSFAHISAEYNAVSTLYALADLGADLEALDLGGNLPAHAAAYQGQVDTLTFLAKRATETLNSRNHVGLRPYDVAAMQKRDKAVAFLELCGFVR